MIACEMVSFRKFSYLLSFLIIAGIFVYGSIYLLRPAKVMAAACSANFSWGFICPRPSPPNLIASDVDIASTPNGTFGGGSRKIAAGHEITFKPSFHATGRSRNFPNKKDVPAIMWVTIDAQNSMTGGINSISGGGSLVDCPGTGGNATVNGASGTAYAGVAVKCGPRSGNGEGKTIFWTYSPYAGINTTKNESFKLRLPAKSPAGVNNDNEFVCVRTYVSVWEDTRLSANNSNNLQYIAGQSDETCFVVTTRIAKVYAVSSGLNDEDDTTDPNGDTVNPEGTLTDHVGTGRKIDGVRITESNICGPNPNPDDNTKTTGSNGTGEAHFAETDGQFFCLRADTFATGPDGTQYRLRTPINNNGTDQDSYENQVAGVKCANRTAADSSWDTDCNSFRNDYDNGNLVTSGPDAGYEVYYFFYDPMPISPPSSKAQSYDGVAMQTANSPTCVANKDNPVCRADYTVTVTNAHDANFKSANIQDQIPLNLRQDASVKPYIDSISIRPTGGAPGGWFVPTQTWSAGANNLNQPLGTVGATPLQFWYGPGAAQDGYVTIAYDPPQSASGGNPSTPGEIQAVFDSLPAYSQIIIRWHGFTKPSTAIGAYPSNQSPTAPYCASTSGIDYTSAGLIDACQNLDPNGDGLEGVYNYATTNVDNDLDNPSSNGVYRPIPGNLANCVTKDADAKYEIDNTYVTPTKSTCSTPPSAVDNRDGVTPVKQIFSDNDPRYNSFNFYMTTRGSGSSDGYWGPAYYQIIDQQCPDTTRGGYTISGCLGANPAFASAGFNEPAPGTPAEPGGTGGGSTAVPGVQNSGSTYSYGVQRMLPNTSSATGYQQIFTLPVDTSNAANPPASLTPSINTAITNKACVRVIDFSQVNHPSHTVCSPTMKLYFLRIESPKIDTNRSNANAGGNPAGPLVCTNASHPSGDPRIRTSNPGNGVRVLTTSSGSRTGLGSVSGVNYAGYGDMCYPDLKGTIAQYEAAHPTQVKGGFGSIGDGDVVKIGAAGTTTTITDGTIPPVNKRYTLHVLGDLHITTSGSGYPIRYDTSTLAGSLGVIVEGNIYIDKDVTNLDGYYYSAPFGSNNLTNATAGIINTCAADANKTLDPNKVPNSGPSATYDANECGKVLNVNGMLMATAFRLNRTNYNTPDSNQVPVKAAEYIQSFGHLFLLTPPGFSDSANTKLTPKSLNDLLPRY